jgi:DNA modification methylase
MKDVAAFVRSSTPFEVIRGDCLRVLKLLPDKSVDAFATDPPYGIELRRFGRKERAIAGDGRIEAQRLWESFVPEAYRAAKDDTAHAFFGTWKSPWMLDILRASFEVKACVIWHKSIWGLGYWVRPQWELFYLCTKGKPRLPAKAEPDVWKFGNVHRPQHPCQKPVELMRRVVKLVAPSGGLIVDPFAGIFSTGVAAVMEDCRFLGVERDARYCRMGRARINQAIKELSDPDAKDAPDSDARMRISTDRDRPGRPI